MGRFHRAASRPTRRRGCPLRRRNGGTMTRDVLLIGLDGATFDVLDPLMNEGAMPVLRELIDSGTRATLRSTVPALTPPAWTSLVTGRGPGSHGIFDFFRKDSESSPLFRFLTSHDVECPSIWSLVN